MMKTVPRLAIRSSRRHVERLQPRRSCRQIEPVVVLALEAGDLGRLLGEGLDHARPAQVLLQPCGQHGQLLLDGQRQRAGSGGRSASAQ